MEDFALLGAEVHVGEVCCQGCEGLGGLREVEVGLF